MQQALQRSSLVPRGAECEPASCLTVDRRRRLTPTRKSKWLSGRHIALVPGVKVGRRSGSIFGADTQAWMVRYNASLGAAASERDP
jgi:hypothetical protein